MSDWELWLRAIGLVLKAVDLLWRMICRIIDKRKNAPRRRVSDGEEPKS